MTDQRIICEMAREMNFDLLSNPSISLTTNLPPVRQAYQRRWHRPILRNRGRLVDGRFYVWPSSRFGPHTYQWYGLLKRPFREG